MIKTLFYILKAFIYYMFSIQNSYRVSHEDAFSLECATTDQSISEESEADRLFSEPQYTTFSRVLDTFIIHAIDMKMSSHNDSLSRLIKRNFHYNNPKNELMKNYLKVETAFKKIKYGKCNTQKKTDLFRKAMRHFRLYIELSNKKRSISMTGSDPLGKSSRFDNDKERTAILHTAGNDLMEAAKLEEDKKAKSQLFSRAGFTFEESANLEREEEEKVKLLSHARYTFTEALNLETNAKEKNNLRKKLNILH